VAADHEPRLNALQRVGHGRGADVRLYVRLAVVISVSTRRAVADHNVGVGGDPLELRGEERLAVAPRSVERPVVEPGLPRSAPELESEQLDARVLEVVAAQSVRDTPGLDGLVVVAGDEHDLGGRNAVEPLPELAHEERLLGGEVSLEREGDVARDQQDVALGDIDQVFVKIGRADDPRHRRANWLRITPLR